MNTLLHNIAADLLHRFGNDLSHIAVVFPNKRASLFLDEELARLSDAPVWAPRYITISELFRSKSDLEIADPIMLICRMYDVFVRVTGYTESIDRFYGWGKLLLADFDDLDKNMAPADRIFSLVSDLHEYDSVPFLTDEQREALRHFFAAFTDNHESQLRKQFLTLWSKLLEVYTTFRAELRNDSLAYEGMLYRDVVEDKTVIETMNHTAYCFVGFNVLQKVEQKLFSRLKAEGKALFYWDYDESYLTEDHEAGHFIRQYLSEFPDALKGKVQRERHTPKITYLASATETLQARYVGEWLLENDRYKAGARTAVVMCDESLLPSVVSSIPEDVNDLNITTGYPVQQTLAVTLLQTLLDFHINGRFTGKDKHRQQHVVAILRHPYARYISEDCERLANDIITNHNYYPRLGDIAIDEGTRMLFNNPLSQHDITGNAAQNHAVIRWMMEITDAIALARRREHDAMGKDVKLSFSEVLADEALFTIHKILVRLDALTTSGWLTVDITTLQMLLFQITSSTSIPFHGEPVQGVQIMGVLETRCLDFDNILILSCNEGKMPRGEGDASFIPHSVRQAYGLTTVNHKVAIYSYYFYRLMSRSSDVSIAYNCSTEGINAGEMSRFMLQMLVESDAKIHRMVLNAGNQSTMVAPEKEIAKTPESLNALRKYFTESKISPSSLATYLRCPMIYYYQYVAKLSEPDNEDIDDFDQRMFGIVFHKAAEMLYQQIGRNTGGVITENMLNNIDRNHIEQIVDKALAEELYHGTQGIEYNGLHLINRSIIISMLKDLVEYDKMTAPITIIGLEKKMYMTIDVTLADGEKISPTIGGTIDRLDMVSDSFGKRLRVIDYKTGAKAMEPIESLEKVFTRNPSSDKHEGYVLQAMLYSSIVAQDCDVNPEELKVTPMLLFMQHIRRKDYAHTLPFGKKGAEVPLMDARTMSSEYLVLLSELIAEILNPDEPFRAEPNEVKCKFCNFNELCQKKKKKD